MTDNYNKLEWEYLPGYDGRHYELLDYEIVNLVKEGNDLLNWHEYNEWPEKGWEGC